MSNEFYQDSGYPSTGAAGSSASMRAELAAIEVGFDKLPGLIGHGSKVVAVNAGGSALEPITTTGTGNGVRATSPSLVTPTLGVATVTSVNGMTLTASTGTFTLTNAKTLTVSNTLTLTATDGATLAIGTGGTLGSAAYTASTAYAAVGATFNLGTTALALNRGSGAVALTGITSIDGNAATVTTNANLTGVITSVGNATSIASKTGTGNTFVVNTSPTLVTPVLGIATMTSLNGLTINVTAGAGLVITESRTFSVANTLTLTSTDGATLAIGGGGTLGSMAYQATTSYAALAGATFTGAVRATRYSGELNTYTPGAGAGQPIDWAKDGSTMTNNGTNAITFSNVPSGVASHFLNVTNFNNTTFPAAVDWGVGGKPSIAGAARVALVTIDSGTTVWGTVMHQAV